MTYLHDKIWGTAKKIAKANGMADNWVEIVDYYNSTGGCHVLVYAIVDNVKYRLLRVTDQEQLLVSNYQNELSLLDYNLVNASTKQFFYSEQEMTQHTIALPEECSIQGASKIKIYV